MAAIQIKKKPCEFHGHDCYIYKRVDGKGYCKYGYLQTFPPKRIPKESAKRSFQNREYSVVREEHLKENPLCIVKRPGGCTYFATQVHHAKGRTGELLTDKRFFKSVCDFCHKWVEANPEEAKKMGFSANRI